MGRGHGSDDHTPSRSLAELRAALEEADKIDDQTERLLEAAAIVSEALADLGVEPVVVGGLAVAYWSRSQYITGEIDFLLPKSREVVERITALGFREEAPRHFVFGERIAFEAPGVQLDEGDQAEEVELASGRAVQILAIEDAVLWRVREFLHWKDSRGFRHTLYMLGSPHLDRQRLDRRARQTGLDAALQWIEWAAGQIQQGLQFETWEIHEVATRLERGEPTMEGQ